MGVSDVFLFLREWLRNPRSVAAVAPSGRALARLITKDVSARTGKVLELGPGTGSFTQALIENGVREENLTLVEYSEEFAQLLKSRYPLASVFQLDAGKLYSHTLFNQPEAGAIVCGLGLLNMPDSQVSAIMRGAFGYLRPGGAFYLFTYGPRCSVPYSILSELGLVASHVGKTWLNIPPASVYRITRRN